MDNEIEIQSLKKIVKGAGIVFIGLLISKLLTYGYRLIAARIGVEEYGLLSLGLAVFGVLTTITVAGLNMGVLRYAAFYKGKKDNERIKGVIVSSLKISLILSLIFIFVMFFSAEWVALNLFHNAGLIIILKMFSFIIPFFSLGMILLAAIIAFQKVEYSTITKEISENLIRIILTIGLVYAGYGLFGAIAGYMIAIVSSFILAFYFLQKKVFQILKTPVKSVFMTRELFSYSWPLMFTNILYMVLSWTDTLMLGYFRTASDVGIYNAALPTATLLTVISTALLGIFVPIITELLAQNKSRELERVYKVTSKWAFFLNFPVFLIMISFSEQILRITFGIKYVGGATPLMILSGGYLVYSIFIFSTKILQVIGKTRWILFITAITAISNAILNFYLIPIYGLIGGAIATSVSLALHGIISYIVVYRFVNFQQISRKYITPAIAGILSIRITDTIAKSLFIQVPAHVLFALIAFFLLLYFAFLLLLKGFDGNDLMILKSIEKKTGFKLPFVKRWGALFFESKYDAPRKII